MYKLISDFLENKNPKDREGVTPLHFSAENGHFEVCELIMDNVSNKNPQNKAGWTPLHWAAGKGKYSQVPIRRVVLIKRVG